MAQYIKMKIANGAVEGELREGPPDLRDAQGNQIYECKGYRWLRVTANANLGVWQSEGDFPATVATNATEISRNVVSVSLANWKAQRVAEMRREQWNRISAAFPIGQVIYYLVVACRIIYKRANGGTLTAGELSTLSGISTAFTGTIEPISVAADNAVAAINAAAKHAAVEAAYAAVAWP